MRLRRSLGVLCLAVATMLVGCGDDEETRADLAFVSTRDGDYAIFVMEADGSAQRRLTPRNDKPSSAPARLFFQFEPAWSPDGSKIAFSSRRSGTFDIYLMHADGTGTARFTFGKAHDSHPTWSRDGTAIAFARDGDVYVARGAGSIPERISDPLTEEREPSWSPDGRWIAYVRRTPGTASRELWVMRADGSKRRALTRQNATVATPAWSPDSTRLVYSTNKDGVYALYTIGVDGKGLRRVAPTARDSFEPSWSPDGATIAYFEDGAIFAVELGSGETEKLTDSDDNDSSPVWNPQPPADE